MGEKEGSHSEKKAEKKEGSHSEKKAEKKEGSHSEKKPEKKEGGAKKSEKEEGPTTVVLKVDLHCEGCARKARSAVKGIEGVETVTTDCASSKLTVLGKVDPWKIKESVEKKVHRTVVLVSPNVPKKEEKKKEEKKDESKEKNEKKAEEKKPKEPAVSTIVLKIRLHCEGCIQRIERIIRKVEGVQKVTTAKEKDEVTVTGTMDGKALPEYLTKKLKRTVTVVTPKKEEGGGDKNKKKEKEKEGEGEEKSKKEGGEKGKKEGGEKGKKEEAKVSKMEYQVQGGVEGFNVPPPSYGTYSVEHWHAPAPQYFSDENPNACSVM